MKPRKLKTASEDGRALKYIKQLDGLRAIAVFAVLWTHYLPEKYWPFDVYWGGLGVRLFFVLSGFLITSILLDCRQYITIGQQTSCFTIRQFYIRRFLRIFPLYYAVLVFAALVHIPPVRETIAWHLPYLSNIYFCIRGDYDGSVSHFWSLAVEEQFYLVWPWLILFLPKKSLLPTIVILILIGPLFRLTATVVGLNQVAIWVLTPSSLDTLGLGSLLAYLKYGQKTFKAHYIKILKATVLICLPLRCFIEILKHTDNKMIVVTVFADTFANTLSGLIFTWVVYQAAIGFKGIIGEVLEFKPIMYLGKISYGIYVIHLFTPYMLSKAFHVFGISYSSQVFEAIFSTVATIVLATISWHFIENPINNLKRFFPLHR